MSESKPSVLHRFVRDPLMHFFVAGACLYLLYYAVAEPEITTDEKTVVVNEGQIEWLVASWQNRWNRPPTQKELDGLIAQHVRETVLYREALEMGLDKDDAVIRRRLSQKVEFLTQDLQQPAPATDDELAAYFSDNIDIYTDLPRISFSHVYFDPDKRGDATLGDAASALTILMQTPADQTDLGAFGDAILLPPFLANKNTLAVERQFGSGFAEAVFAIEPGAWHGPTLSGYGMHLVYVHERITPAAPSLANVHARVVADWIDMKSQELNDEFLARLMDRYAVIIEPFPDVTLTPDGS